MAIVAQFEQDGCGHAYRSLDGRLEVGLAARHRRDGSPRLVFDTTVIFSKLCSLEEPKVKRARLELLVRRDEMPLAGPVILGKDVWSEFRSQSEGVVKKPLELPEFGASTFDWDKRSAQVYDWWVRLGTPSAWARDVRRAVPLYVPVVTVARGLAVVPGGGCYFNTHGVETHDLGEVVIDNENGYTCFFPKNRPLNKNV